jgi:hypothetical protein
MTIAALNVAAMLVGYSVMAPLGLLVVLAVFRWLFDEISYAAYEGYYRVKQRRSAARAEGK